jgi:hypothetical protein
VNLSRALAKYTLSEISYFRLVFKPRAHADFDLNAKDA